MKEDLKKLIDMNKDGANSQANVVKIVENEDDLFFATNDEVVKTKCEMDFVSSKHICRDRKIFDTLKTNEEFSHFMLENGGKIKGAWGWSFIMVLFKLSQMWD